MHYGSCTDGSIERAEGAAAAHHGRMDTVETAVNALGGIATRQQLLREGLTGFDLTRAVRRASVRRVRQGRYASSTASGDAIAATRVGGMLAGPSAAASYGLWAGFDTRLHISVGSNSSRLRMNGAPSVVPIGRRTPDTSPREVVVHWLEGGAVPELGPECWRVPMRVCLRQVVEWGDKETAMACLESALRSISLTELRHIFTDACPAHRLIAAAAQPGAGSGPETIVDLRISSTGIHLRRQVFVTSVGWVDFGVVGTKIVIEIDGYEYHSDPAAFERDRRRDAQLVALGYTVIRLSFRQVFEQWAWCESVILAAIARHVR